MKASIFPIVPMLACMCLSASLVDGQGLTGPPTFSKDISPILRKHCAVCHRPGALGPMSLMTYDETRVWASQIKRRVASREMPPWFADGAGEPFKNEDRLTTSEIETVVRWVDSGIPAGDAVAPNDQALEWMIVPDEIREAIQLPETDESYLSFRLPVGLPQEKWVQAIEIKFSEMPVVRQVVLSAVPRGESQAQGSTPAGTILEVLTAGVPLVRYEPGIGKRLPAGSDIVARVLYSRNKAATYKITVGIEWAKGERVKSVVTDALRNSTFKIPPGSTNTEVQAAVTLGEQIEVISWRPFMLARGKTARYVAHYPDGRSETLLDVPAFDFRCPMLYELSRPKVLPKGTRLEFTATFDNSAANRFIRGAAREIGAGDTISDEWMVGWYTFVRP